jgi:hypothetical protein
MEHSIMRKKMFCLALLSVFVFSLSVVAQQTKKPLTNSDVVEMTKAGLTENTIILAIQQGPSQFDTSPSALIQLKNQGVSAKVLDAMIQPNGSTAVPSQPTGGAPQQSNVNNPLLLGQPGNVAPTPASSVILIDGSQRIEMKYSTPEMRTNSMLGAVVNPFHKTRIRTALNGNHAKLRTNTTSPMFEVAIRSEANPSDIVALVKLSPKSETREIETMRGSITGTSSGFRKEDRVPITIEEKKTSTVTYTKTYIVKIVAPLAPGEYALAYGAGTFYDFGIDGN